MKKLCCSLILFAMITTLVLAAPPDFSGKWVINKEKSDFRLGPDGPTPDFSMTITQSAASIDIKQKISTEQGEFEREYKLIPDGQAHETPWFMNRPAQVTSKWDGSVLVLEAVQETQEGDKATTKDRWELSADGKTLTMTSSMQSPMGEWNSKRVMDKQ